jgi:hypothetical protein
MIADWRVLVRQRQGLGGDYSLRHSREFSILAGWTKLSVRTNTTGTVPFDDPGATNRPARFYRVVVP